MKQTAITLFLALLCLAEPVVETASRRYHTSEKDYGKGLYYVIKNDITSYMVYFQWVKVTAKEPPKMLVGTPEPGFSSGFLRRGYTSLNVNGISSTLLEPKSIDKFSENGKVGLKLLYNFNGCRLFQRFYMKDGKAMLYMDWEYDATSTEKLESAEILFSAWPSMIIQKHDYKRAIQTKTRLIDTPANGTKWANQNKDDKYWILYDQDLEPSTKKGAEDRAWMEDTNDHVAMCAKGIIGTDAQGNPNWERLSKVVVDGKGIHQTVQSVQNGLVNAESKIEQTETSITQVVTEVGSNGKVTAASIMTSINNDHSEIRISADKVFLEGNISLNSVLKVLSNTATFTGLVQFGTDSSTRIRIGSGWVSTPGVRLGSGTQVHQVNFAVLDKMIKTMESRSGGTIRLTRFDGTYLDFNKAISSWTWGGGNSKINVTALPQNQTKSVKVSIDGRTTISSNGTYTYTVDYENSDGDDESTGATKTVTVDVYPNTKQFYCSNKSTAGGVTTYTFTYSSSSSSVFNSGSSYKFHHNTGYT